jgi:hypothetical protein
MGGLVVATLMLMFAASCVAASVTHLVAVEVLLVVNVVLWRCMLAAVGVRAAIAGVGVVVVVDVAVEVFRAVIPRAGTYEDAAAVEPLGAIVTVGSTAVGSGVVVAVGTVRRDTDVDANLRVRLGSMYCKAETGDGGCCKSFKATHVFTSVC